MDIKTIVKILIGVMGCTLLYAADWQREQDQRMSGLDVLLARQDVLLERQQQILQIQVQLNEMEVQLKKRSRARDLKRDIEESKDGP